MDKYSNDFDEDLFFLPSRLGLSHGCNTVSHCFMSTQSGADLARALARNLRVIRACLL